MIDFDEIRLWQNRLECEDPSWTNYEKLAILYAIQDHNAPVERPVPSYSAAPSPVGDYGDSDFLRAVQDKDPAEAWNIMDELMETLKVVNQRVYNSIMRKLDAL